MAFCTNCGSQVPDDAAFCSGCGTRVGTGAAAAGIPHPPAAPPLDYTIEGDNLQIVRVKLKPGQERKEVEGVFVVRDNKAVFEMVKTGIAGEKYFEVLSGLKDGDLVVVGPFSSVRTLADGALVKVEQAPRGPAAAASK